MITSHLQVVWFTIIGFNGIGFVTLSVAFHFELGQQLRKHPMVFLKMATGSLPLLVLNGCFLGDTQ